jgi:ABC-2 type transport system ATP-binding protein
LHPEVAMNYVFEELARHNIQVISMRNKSNRLEELFMDIVKTQK